MKTDGKDMVRKYRNWSVGSTVIALVAIAVMAWELLSRPEFMFLGHNFQVTQGMLIAGLMMGGLFWMIIEIFTPPGKNLIDLLARPFVGFIAGAFIGGFYGYEFNFGAYVILPAHNGNLGAQVELLGIFLAFVVFVLNAAWSHNKSYRGVVKDVNGGNGKSAAIMIPFTATTTISASGIFQSIWNLIMGFISNIMNSISGAAGTLISSIGSSLGGIVSGWADAAAAYGIWGPMMAIISLGVAFIVGGFMLDLTDAFKDIGEVESEV